MQASPQHCCVHLGGLCALRRLLLLLLLVPGHQGSPGSTGWCLPRMCSRASYKEHPPKAEKVPPPKVPEKNLDPKHIIPLLPLPGEQRTAAVWSHGLKLLQIKIIQFMKNSKHHVFQCIPSSGVTIGRPPEGVSCVSPGLTSPGHSWKAKKLCLPVQKALFFCPGAVTAARNQCLKPSAHRRW